MKRLFSAATPPDEGLLQLLRSAMEAEGIKCMVRNEALIMGKGDLPLTECVPELWIMDDKDCSRAQQIVDEWKRINVEPHASWLCPHCKETIEGQFTSCWKCGNARAEE